MPLVVAFVIDERDGNMQSGKTQRHANVVVDAETWLSPRRRATYRELNDAWNLRIPRQSYIIKRVYDIPRPSWVANRVSASKNVDSFQPRT